MVKTVNRFGLVLVVRFHLREQADLHKDRKLNELSVPSVVGYQQPGQW